MLYEQKGCASRKNDLLTVVCLISVILGFTCGALMMDIRDCAALLSRLTARYAYPLRSSADGSGYLPFFSGYLYQLIPLYGVFISGYGWLTIPTASLFSFARALISGFSCCVLLTSGGSDMPLSILKYSGFILFEGVFLLMLVSFSREAIVFRRTCCETGKPPFASKMTVYYCFDFLFLCGITFVLWFLRSLYCRLL